MRHLILAVAFLSLPVSALHGQTAASPDSTQLAWARKFLLAAQVERSMLSALDTAVTLQRNNATTKGRRIFFDSLKVRMHRAVPALTDSLAVLMAGQFSSSDLQQLTTFYLTPVGQRYAATQADLEPQLLALGQRWGARIGMATASELLDKGLITASDLGGGNR